MKNNIQIREYVIDDIKSITEIYYNTIHKINVKDYTKEQLEAWAPKTSLRPDYWIKRWKNIPNIFVYVALINDTIVGFVEFKSNGYIDCFYVHHQFLGRGIGTLLMQKIYKEAKKFNISKIYAEVSITAKMFFIANNFQIERKQIVNHNGIDFVNYKMSKLL